MAGHACKLIEIDEPALLDSAFTLLFEVEEALPNLEFEMDFLWIGRFIVNTLVLEPNAPSIDIVTHEGWQRTELDEAWAACKLLTLFADALGDFIVDEAAACLDELFEQ